MKKILLITLIVLTATSTNLLAQAAPPPPPGHDAIASQDGGDRSAPIGSGLFILLSFGAAYGGKKLYDLRKEKLEE